MFDDREAAGLELPEQPSGGGQAARLASASALTQTKSFVVPSPSLSSNVSAKPTCRTSIPANIQSPIIMSSYTANLLGDRDFGPSGLPELPAGRVGIVSVRVLLADGSV